MKRWSNRKPPTVAAADRAVRQFNAAHPVGTLVEFWQSAREGEGRRGETIGEAFCLNGRIPVVFIRGARGCIALTHVEPIAEAVQR